MEKQTIRVNLFKCRPLSELEQDSEYDIINEMVNVQLDLWTRQLKTYAKRWSRDMSRLKMHVSEVWEILNAYASDNIHGQPSKVYSFMRNRNDLLGLKMYGALVRVLIAPEMTRHEVFHSFFAAFVEHLQGLFTTYEYQRLSSAAAGMTAKNHSTRTSLKRKPRTNDIEASMKKVINETLAEQACLANKRVHDNYNELRRVSKLPLCPLQ